MEFTNNFYTLQSINLAMLPTFKEEIKAFLTLNQIPKRDKFNSSDIVVWFINRVVAEIVKVGNHANASCIAQQVQGSLNQAAIAAVGQDLALLRNITTSLFTINAQVKNITRTLLSKVPPANQCIMALLKQTCSKCQKTIPKLCRNVCGAVVKGCFAPYVAALNPQFNILWNVTAQLVQFLNATLTDLFTQQALILNRTLLVMVLLHQWITVLSIYTFYVFFTPTQISQVRSVCNVTTLQNSFSGGQTFTKPNGVRAFLAKAVDLLNTGLVSYSRFDQP